MNRRPWRPALARRAAPFRRYVAGLLAAAAAVTGLAVITLEDGFSINSFALGTGTVWVASSQTGQLALLDGSSAEVSVRLAVAPARHDLLAIQSSSAGYAVDRSAGSIIRVDAAKWTTSKAIQLIADSSTGLSAVATDLAMYAIDGDRGLVQEADPVSMQARGAPRSLSAQPAPGSPVVDRNGVLWVLDTRSGDLLRVQGDVDRTAPAVGPGSAARLILAGGSPVVVDPSAGTAVPINPSSGEADGDAVCIDADRQDTSVRIGGTRSVPVIYVVSGADGVLRITDLDTGRCDQVVPGIATPGSSLGEPVEVGGHVYIPDFSAGRVVVVNLRTLGLVPTEQIVEPGAEFDLIDRDGFVFYNDRSSERAGVVRLDGSVRTIAKYDVEEPGKGVHVPEPEPDPVDLAAAAGQTPTAQSTPPSTSPPPSSSASPETSRPETPATTASRTPGPGGGGPSGNGDGGGRTTVGPSFGRTLTEPPPGPIRSGSTEPEPPGSSDPPPSDPPPSDPPPLDPPPLDPPPFEPPPLDPPPLDPPPFEPPPVHVDTDADLVISTPGAGIAGQPVDGFAISVKAGSGISRATWTFGNGGDEGVSLSHEWQEAGDYTVYLDVERVSGTTHTVSGGSISIAVAPDRDPPWFCPTPLSLTVYVEVGSTAAGVDYPYPAACDAVDPSPAVSCNPPSGWQFSPGWPEWVTCTATDQSGNTAEAGFDVNVVAVDHDPPVFGSCPNVWKSIPYTASGGTVHFACTATDNSGSASVGCSPPSGSSFRAGATTVSCSAVDPSGNRADLSFVVTVEKEDPPGTICNPGLRRPTLLMGVLPFCP